MSGGDASEGVVVCSCCGSSLAKGAKNENASPCETPSQEDVLVATPEFVGTMTALALERLSTEGRAFFLALPYGRRAKIIVTLVRLGILR